MKDRIETFAEAAAIFIVLAAVLVGLGLLLTGCVTSSYRTDLTAPDGTVKTTRYVAIGFAPPFSKVEAGDFSMAQKPDGEVAVGQNAKGIDTTGQTAALTAAMEGAVSGAVKAATSVAIGGVVK
jgi:hypothetical protein